MIAVATNKAQSGVALVVALLFLLVVTIKEKSSGKLVSRSVVYFKLWTLPTFIASLRPA